MNGLGDCAEFCEKYDQNSFDPEYPTEPLESFESAVREVFKTARKRMDTSDGGWDSEKRPEA